MIAHAPLKAWDHQQRGLDQSKLAWVQGLRRWTIVAPCGAGKSLIMERHALPAIERGMDVVLLIHRRLLLRQLVKQFDQAQVAVGVFASGWSKRINPRARIQICSVQTLLARRDKEGFEMPPADMVIWDEMHAQANEMSITMLEHYADARHIQFTATPVGLTINRGKDKHGSDRGSFSFTQRLINAGTYTEMLKCKAHLPIHCYEVEIPDPKQLKPTAVGEFSESQVRKVIKVKTIFGNVFREWERLNPNQLPTILFAPGVPESKWFVYKFAKRGIRAAHIDAEKILLAKPEGGILKVGEYERTEERLRELEEGSRNGDYAIVCNRFVMREAINWPWIYHCVLATAMGGLSTYLQSVGREQRFWPEYDHVILQDHGGNLERHGAPDLDRNWKIDSTNKSMNDEREKENAADKPDDEPVEITCPKCSFKRLRGPACPACGHVHKTSVRMVRMEDGTLRRHTGKLKEDPPPKKPKTFDDYFKSAVFASAHRHRSVNQAMAMAKRNAAKDGIPFSDPTTFKLPADAKQRKKSVCTIYPVGKRRKGKGIVNT